MKEAKQHDATADLLHGVGQMLPPYVLLSGMLKMSKTARMNAYCHLNKHNCPDIPIIDEFDDKLCCGIYFHNFM